MIPQDEIRESSIWSWLARVAAWFGYAFLILPTLIVIPTSFGNTAMLTFPPRQLSLDYYRSFFAQSDWVGSAVQSFQIATVVMVLALIIGVGAAYGLARSEFPGRKLVMLLLLSPIFVPGIVIGLALYLYFARLGISGTRLGLIIGHTIAVVPFVIVTANAGLKQVDRNLELAASLMGAGRFHVLRRVVMPLLMPSVIAAGLFAFLLSFDEVIISYFIASVREQTLPVKMYSAIRWEISPVIAAVSSMLTALALIVCVATALIQKANR